MSLFISFIDMADTSKHTRMSKITRSKNIFTFIFFPRLRYLNNLPEQVVDKMKQNLILEQLI